MTVRIHFTPEAEQQLADLKQWWAENRAAARTQVADEVERIIAQIADYPGSGTPYKRAKNSRSHRLRKTPYRLYYEYKPGGDEVWVVSIWSVMRKRGPPL